ncbi:uncharacterized protein K444DRAFT_175980 [Hyaloscypha bicolor E]|uniref:Uncharacterized protein n=1 Tax=Hyaloscypha bicolor E TaxID=1095630 RepID=A0A2J6TQG3_9HELO|nr:uncharacterized protein K444DRAFT_175980 [Hyaloscypha bicolor E]PMD65264.1 hypothetical protein K444DRAFT_175980 [Hyaloscypha bicolor E]
MKKPRFLSEKVKPQIIIKEKYHGMAAGYPSQILASLFLFRLFATKFGNPSCLAFSTTVPVVFQCTYLNLVFATKPLTASPSLSSAASSDVSRFHAINLKSR